MPPSDPRAGLLEAAKHLMLSKGYWGTTVDEICEAAGVSKGSFYHHFGAKDDLGVALIDHYFTQVADTLMRGSYQSLEDPLDRLEGFVAHAAAQSKTPALLDGCLLGCFTLELSQVAPSVQTALAERFERLTAALENLIRLAIRKHPPSQPLDPGALARQFVAVLEGGIILAKAHDRPEYLEEGIRVFGELLQRSFDRSRA